MVATITDGNMEECTKFHTLIYNQTNFTSIYGQIKKLALLP